MQSEPSPQSAVVAIPNNATILSLIPLVYVAWADGELTPEEITAIREKLSGRTWVTPETEDFLQTWLQPSAPPTALQLQALLLTIRQGVVGLDPRQRSSLVELGAELARRQDTEIGADVRHAIVDIEQALEIDPREAAGELFAEPAPSVEPLEPTPVIDADALTVLLDGEWREFRQRMRVLLGEPEFAYRYGLAKEAYREQVLVWCRRLAGEGLGALSFPAECGGEADIGKFAVAFEMLAFHDLSLLIKYGVQFGLFGGSINMLGTERHRRVYLRDAGSLELPGCYAMTERGHGSNVAGVETTATYDAATGEFIVHTPVDQAHKEFIGNAARHARMATVFAQLIVQGESHGVHALLVPIRDAAGKSLPGVRIEDSGEKLGLNGIDNGRLWFDQVRVPRENLLNRYADVDQQGNYTSDIASPSKRFFTTLGALVAGRVSIALGSNSAAKSGLTIATRYGDRRRQFGPPGQAETCLLDYRSHQRRLLPSLATTYALHFALDYLRQRFVDRGEHDQREVESLAAGLKAYASWHAVATLQACRECCGGQGYLTVNRFAHLKADIEIFTTFEGDNTVLMQLLAKSLLTDYRRQFEDLRAYTIIKYLADRASTVISELNPVVTHNSAEDHLRDRDFQLAAFEYRESRLIATAAQRLRTRISDGMSSHEAFNDCQDHLLTMANAHVENVILERFADAVDEADEALRPPLALLRDVFALSRLEADRAWFLEAGYISTGKSKAIRGLVNKLCAEVRPLACRLVDAFAIPDELLAAPIAMKDSD